MSSLLVDLGIDRLSAEERLQLVQEIWETLEVDSVAGQLPITDAQKMELDRLIASLDAHPDAVVSWEVVEARARARLRR